MDFSSPSALRHRQWLGAQCESSQPRPTHPRVTKPEKKPPEWALGWASGKRVGWALGAGREGPW